MLAAILAIGATAVWALFVMSLALVAGSDFIIQGTKFDPPYGLIVVLLAPSPALAAIQLLFLTPLSQTHGRGFAFQDFGNSVLSAARADALALLLVLLVSAGLAIWCHRRQRRHSDQGAVAWAVFVLAMGLPGFVGYLLHRRWPATEFCANCRKISPRDRDACLHCGNPFPQPAPKGIEIFA
jgi:hypothetical protein